MNKVFQIILILGSTLSFLLILNMVRKKSLELKYALTWLITSFSFIVLALFPKIINFVSILLHIKEEVNALFLLILFFMLIIIYTLTIALSRSTNKITTLAQEIGLLKLDFEKLKNEIRGD